MPTLYLATTNARKIEEAQNAAALFSDITVEPVALDIDEIQSNDPAKITLHKAEQAYALVKKPVIVNDSSWNIPALGGFPGGYMKDVIGWFTTEDFIALLQNKDDKRIACIDTVVYADEHGTQVLTKEYWGELSLEPKGQGNALEQLALFNGRTMAEAHNAGEHAFAAEAYIWHDFFRTLRRTAA